MALGSCRDKAVPCQGCVILDLAVPHHTMPPYATPHHAVCYTVLCLAEHHRAISHCATQCQGSAHQAGGVVGG